MSSPAVVRRMAERWSPLRVTAHAPNPDATVAAVVQALLAHGQDVVHHYPQQGVSWVRLGAGARVTVHTWPEHQLATVDVLGSSEAEVLAALAAQGWRVLNR